tara:strand:+ start:60 stop:452 length:393 start_codon:yes stop_codon:yes gene_type:complete
MKNLSITPSTNNIGAYINNINLKNLDQNQIKQIKDTLNQFGVIFIKSQNLDPMAYQNFAKNIGQPDEEWLILIYLKNNSPDEGIIIEDKTDPERNISHEFKSNEIFKASDMMVDALTKLLDKERNKKKAS